MSYSYVYGTVNNSSILTVHEYPVHLTNVSVILIQIYSDPSNTGSDQLILSSSTYAF